jgi:hypothetical protein
MTMLVRRDPPGAVGASFAVEAAAGDDVVVVVRLCDRLGADGGLAVLLVLACLEPSLSGSAALGTTASKWQLPSYQSCAISISGRRLRKTRTASSTE